MAPPHAPTPYRPGFAVQDLVLLILLLATFSVALLAVPSFDSALTAQQWWAQSRLYWLIPLLITLAALIAVLVRRLLSLRTGFLSRVARALLLLAVIGGVFLLTTRVRAIELRQNWAEKRATSLTGGPLSHLARPIPCGQLGANAASGVTPETCQRLDTYRTATLNKTVASLNEEKQGLSADQMAAQLAAAAPAEGGKEDPPPTDDLCEGQDQTKCAIAGIATIACLVLSEGAAWQECLALFALIMGIGGGGGADGAGLSVSSQQNVGQTIAAIATGSQPAAASAPMADEQDPRAFDVANSVIVKLVADGRLEKTKADQLSTTLLTQKTQLTGSLLSACTARLAQRWSEMNQASPDWCALKKLQTEGPCRSIELADADLAKAAGSFLSPPQIDAFTTASPQCGQ